MRLKYLVYQKSQFLPILECVPQGYVGCIDTLELREEISQNLKNGYNKRSIIPNWCFKWCKIVQVLSNFPNTYHTPNSVYPNCVTLMKLYFSPIINGIKLLAPKIGAMLIYFSVSYSRYFYLLVYPTCIYMWIYPMLHPVY